MNKICCLCFGQFSVKNTLRQEGVFIENKSKGNVGDSRHFNKLNGECVPTFSELILQENRINLFSYFKSKFLTNKLLGKSWSSTHRGQILNDTDRKRRSLSLQRTVKPRAYFKILPTLSHITENLAGHQQVKFLFAIMLT